MRRSKPARVREVASSSLVKAIVLTGLIISVPLCELGLLRLWLKYGLNLHLGLPGFVDFDLLIPGMVSVFILVLAHIRELPWATQFSYRVLVLNGLFFLLAAGLSYFYRQIEGFWEPQGAYLVWWLGIICVGISGLVLSSPLRQVLTRSRGRVLVPCFALAFSIVAIKNLYLQTWPWFGSLSFQIGCQVFQFIGVPARCSVPNPSLFVLSLPGFAYGVGPACSGLDAVIFFLVAFFAFRSNERGQLSKWRGLTLFVLGGVLALFLNVLRIVLLIAVGESLNAFSGSSVSHAHFVAFLFHSHLGWILYLLGFGGFFYLSKRYPMSARRVGIRGLIWRHRASMGATVLLFVLLSLNPGSAVGCASDANCGNPAYPRCMCVNVSGHDNECGLNEACQDPTANCNEMDAFMSWCNNTVFHPSGTNACEWVGGAEKCQLLITVPEIGNPWLKVAAMFFLGIALAAI